MSQTSCFCIIDAAISARALAERDGRKTAQAARWWPDTFMPKGTLWHNAVVYCQERC